MEYRDLYDINRNLTGQTVAKGEEIPQSLRIVCVCAVIVNSKGEFLIQKRVPNKNGKFGLTSGHPKSGESSKDGMITELFEELGIIVPPEELVLFHSELHDEKSFRDLYYYKTDLDPEELIVQADEVEFAKWATFDEIAEHFSNVLFCHTHFEDLQKFLKYCQSSNQV